jgi:aromatic-L-amino-acid decarboxylase
MGGLGLEAVVEIPVTSRLTLDTETLKRRLAQDRREGLTPFLIVGTLGSTSAGVNDPLNEIAAIAKSESCWFHVDAAWGGSACLLPEFSGIFAPCAEADSLTLDAHKWLNVPMTAGMYFSRRAESLDRAFRVTPSPYMPNDSSDVTPPYHRSLGWSRRFNGLKLFLSLAVSGVEGYRQTLRHQIAMGAELRKLLVAAQWKLENETPFPVVCFSDDRYDSAEIARLVGDSGKAWVTTTLLTSTGKTVLRAGISNAATQREHLENLIVHLESARLKSAKA